MNSETNEHPRRRVDDMEDGDNGRVTIAVLSQQILTLTSEMTALRKEMREINNGITDYRIVQSRHDTQIIILGQNFDALSGRINGWSIINSAGVVIAGILALFFGNKQP